MVARAHRSSAACSRDVFALLDASAALLPAVREHIDAQSLHKVTQTISSVVQMGNQYIDVQAPWSLRKTDTERMATVLWVLLESMRFVGILYQPVVPSISAALLDQLGVPHDRRSFAAVVAGYDDAMEACLNDPDTAAGATRAAEVLDALAAADVSLKRRERVEELARAAISRNRAAVDDDRLKRDEDILGMVLQNRRVEV